MGSGGEGVASSPSDPPPEETAETNQAPGGEGVVSLPSDLPPEETAETNQAPGGEGVVSLPSDPPPEETAETNQAPGGEGVVSLPSDPPPEETAETNQAPGGGVASSPSDPPAPETKTNQTHTPPAPPETLETQDSSQEVSETSLQVGYSIAIISNQEETALLKIQEYIREIKKMLEARSEVETALVALVRDLEPISSIARNVERLVVEVDEAKVIHNPLLDWVGWGRMATIIW